MMNKVNLSKYNEVKPKYFKRIIWMLINKTIFRLMFGLKLHGIRNYILRIFGAKVPHKCLIYASCKIYAPWNLEVGIHTCIGPNTEVYNKDKVILGENIVISQGSYICTASHDISSNLIPLITSPIRIDNQAWVAADCFVGPGVTVGEGAVVGARSAVFKDVAPWTVVGGNPAKFIKKRIIKD